MIGETTQPIGMYVLCVLALLVSAIYCIMVSRNLVRILIGVELVTKALTLLLIVAGYFTGRSAEVQALVIVLIVVEVVVIAVAAGIVIGVYRRTDDLNARDLQQLKG